jgi:hypothetical protein
MARYCKTCKEQEAYADHMRACLLSLWDGGIVMWLGSVCFSGASPCKTQQFNYRTMRAKKRLLCYAIHSWYVSSSMRALRVRDIVCVCHHHVHCASLQWAEHLLVLILQIKQDSERTSFNFFSDFIGIKHNYKVSLIILWINEARLMWFNQWCMIVKLFKSLATVNTKCVNTVMDRV